VPQLTKDSVLGWVLILLVGISLFLSYAIWSRVPGELSTARNLQEETTVDLASVIRPQKILVHMGNSIHTVLNPSNVFYDKVWKMSKKVLADQWAVGKPEPVEINPEFVQKKKCVEVVFPTPLPTPFLRQILNKESSDAVSLEGRQLVSYLLVEDKEILVYLKDIDDRYYKIGSEPDTGKLTSVITEIEESKPLLYANLPSANTSIKISKGIFISLEGYELPVYAVKRDKNSKERLAAKFFPDFSITRKIQEKDGAVIYTDGQRGLRIYQDGALEFSFPGVRNPKKTSTLYDVLNVAVDFVNTHGGWPRDTYLCSYDTTIESQNITSYTLKFQSRVNGIPLISDDDYLVVTVEGNQVKRFYRRDVSEGNSISSRILMMPIQALDAAVAVKNVKNVEDIYPAYYYNNDIIKPVWVVKTRGSQIIISEPSE
jgi:regulatory protein YycH of two-component signal transduction system YycFG